jgi:hypothetical protein
VIQFIKIVASLIGPDNFSGTSGTDHKIKQSCGFRVPEGYARYNIYPLRGIYIPVGAARDSGMEKAGKEK